MNLVELQKIVSDDELSTVWGNANFGTDDKRHILKMAVLKCASGYYQGYTSKTIATELGLISLKYKLTKKGKQYLWYSCADDINF